MARFETTQNSFTAGEWSPLMLGRGDLPRYQQCATKLENAVVLIQGGARRRWGTRYIAEVKDSSKAVRLMPFRFSNSQTYVVELGDLYARFYTQDTRIESPPGTPVEVVTPWTEAQLPDLEWAQYSDTAIIVHPDVVPYRLLRVSSTQWKLAAAPFVVWPSDEIGLQPSTNITAMVNGVGTACTTAAAAFLAADVGRQIIADTGTATITAFTSTTQVTVTASGFLSGTYAAGAWTITESPKTTLTLTAVKNMRGGAVTMTLGAAGWRSTDVGSYINMLDGLVEITGFSSTTVVTGKVREVMNSQAIAAAVVESESWRLEPKTWNATRGYPRAVALHEQRLLFGGTYADPTAMWASQVGLYYDLSRGVRDAAGFAQQFFAYDMSTIMHLVSAPTTLLALTASAEMSAGTGNDAAMAPTNIRPRTGSLNGASSARPAVVNNDVLFAQDGGTRVRALAYTDTENAFWSPDITWESQHLFESGIKEMAHSKDPHPITYAVLNNGTIAACAVSRQAGTLQHDVLAWSSITTDGLFESAATIRYGAEDELWLVVNRTINGSTKRYIELADWDLNTDCALTGTSGAPTAAWSGFDHLEAKTLDVLGDGIEMADQTVAAGAIRTANATTGSDRPASTLEAGLPYYSTVTLPDIEPPGNSFGGASVSVHEIIVDLVETRCLEVQENELRWHRFGPAVLDSAPPSITGKKKAPNLGWDGGAVKLRQIHPYPWHIRRVIRRYTVNEG